LRSPFLLGRRKRRKKRKRKRKKVNAGGPFVSGCQRTKGEPSNLLTGVTGGIRGKKQEEKKKQV